MYNCAVGQEYVTRIDVYMKNYCTAEIVKEAISRSSESSVLISGNHPC
jgi:hypothetical protein